MSLRYDLAEALAKYFLIHLEQELLKPKEVTEYVTLEGDTFLESTISMIHTLEKKFPDIRKSKPKFNYFKHWWNKEFSFRQDTFKVYDQTTFKTQNQIQLFKILDILSPNDTVRQKLIHGMTYTIKKFREKGRNISFELIFSSEARMLPYLELVTRTEKLPFLRSKRILNEQNIFMQKTAYNVIDNELRISLEKTDKILKSIFPEKIVLELKEKGKVEPELLNSVSVGFCDLEGFTNLSASLSPENLLHELDDSYTHFDRIIKMMRLEKLKTIGDSYMFVAGLNPNLKLHAVDSILASLRIQEFLRKYEKSKIKKGLPSWKVRIGIHSGSVVAGILGKDRFNYDLWGDTVNVAQRMESSSMGGKVNVSFETKTLAEDFFDFESRGKIFAKGKGELEQFFVTGIKKELSLNARGKTPNQGFKKIYKRKLLS
jgi:class 3 adenylate cyclase